jgi:predicted O-linked N-acetylglucosamine transferase (SPINDLY family)
MRILARVPGSVLWLRSDDRTTVTNLRQHAEGRGVASERLVVAAAVPSMERHLARYRSADLFLDTWPYGAHTTASDALWAGLPVLTCAGETFASRVAASLLTSVGLPELITWSPERYEELAVELANDAIRLAELRQRLSDRRLTCPLFDTEQYTRHLESRYVAIVDRYQTGQPPAHIE